MPQGSILGPVLFLLYLNDLEENLIHSRAVLFADDTVLYVADPSFSTIESKLNADLKNLYKYFTENELVINLKKNKTESMLFGTAKRLSSCPDELDLRYHDTKIISTTTYTYLGTTFDKTLNMGENFRVTYRKLSSKLRLLSSLKPCLTKKSLGMIYQGIILPTVLFNCIVNLNYSNTQLTMLESEFRRSLGKNDPVPSTKFINMPCCLLRNVC